MSQDARKIMPPQKISSSKTTRTETNRLMAPRDVLWRGSDRANDAITPATAWLGTRNGRSAKQAAPRPASVGPKATVRTARAV